jgi:hypothetical protein
MNREITEKHWEQIYHLHLFVFQMRNVGKKFTHRCSVAGNCENQWKSEGLRWATSASTENLLESHLSRHCLPPNAWEALESGHSSCVKQPSGSFNAHYSVRTNAPGWCCAIEGRRGWFGWRKPNSGLQHWGLTWGFDLPGEADPRVKVVNTTGRLRVSVAATIL